jgi:hypothetical protein
MQFGIYILVGSNLALRTQQKQLDFTVWGRLYKTLGSVIYVKCTVKLVHFLLSVINTLAWTSTLAYYKIRNVV